MSEDLKYQNEVQQPLPNATAILVLGIIAIVGCLFYSIPGLICGIISLVLANKSMALYNSNPNGYLASTFNNIKAGKTCAIIGICLSVIYLIILIATFTFLKDNPEFLKAIGRYK